VRSEFVTILQRLVTEQGKETLLNPSKCKAFLSDYTRGEYKKESRFILQAIEAGVSKAIDTTVELEISIKQQIRELIEEYGLAEEVAVDIVNSLALVLSKQKIITSQSDICTNCGKELQKEWEVCPFCGTAVRVQKKQSSMPTPSITHLNIKTSMQNYSAESDFNVRLEKNGITIIKYIGSIKILNIPPRIHNIPVFSIGGWAFNRCTSLTSITIPDSVISIGNNAFTNCTSLISVTISESVLNIGAWAFRDCTNLKSITIPSSVINIGDSAFLHCDNLTSVIFKGTISSSSFYSSAFYGDLHEKYISGGRGTYIRSNGGTTWRKQ